MNIQDFLQAMSNSAASNVSAPVDGINWLLKKAGANVSDAPFLGSDWLEKNGYTKPVSQSAASLMGETAGMLTPFGSSAIIKAANGAKNVLSSIPKIGKIGSSMASRSPRMLDPKPTPQRPFHDDYPQGITGQDGSRLAIDIDGNPISQGSIIAGRRMGQGVDQGLSRGDQDWITSALGIPVQAGRSSSIGGDAGRYSRDTGIFLDQGLDTTQSSRVFSHEVGHAIDDRAQAILSPTGSKISSTGVKKGLLSNYESLNTPGWYKPGRGQSPKDQGYKPKEVDGELFAEAIRAYMTDPNAFKTNFPEVAKRIRAYVNTNPNLKDVIQFNGGAGVGLIAMDEEKK